MECNSLILIGKPPATVTWTSNDSSTADANNYSFSGRSIGVADDTRLVLVAVSFFSFATTLSGVAVGGASCTLVGGSTSVSGASLWRVSLNASYGTSATVQVGFSGGTAGMCIISVYAIRNLISHTPYHTATGSPMSLNFPALGAAVGIRAASTTWSAGLTEDFESSADGQFLSTASGTSTSPETGRTVTSGSGAFAASWG